MLCDNCKQKDANVHITKIINNDKTALNLCEDCAREYQQQMGFSLQPSFSFHKLLASLLEQPSLVPGETGGNQGLLKCPECGTTRQIFSQCGKLGCDQCYEVFGIGLKPLIKRVHGRERHTGKVPMRSGEDIRFKQQLERLKTKLQKLVIREEFEEAARVRDQIKELGSQED